MTRSVGLVLVTLLVVAVTGGCGDAGDGDGASTRSATTHTTVTTTTTQAARTQTRRSQGGARVSDATLANRALVRLADLPRGWTEDGGTVTRLRCDSFEPFRDASALVRSTRLTQEHAGVQERVAIFPTVAIAIRELRRLDSPPAAACLRREVRRRVSEEAGGPASPARLVRVERLSPRATARRYVSVSVSSYGKVVSYIDAVHVRVGRAIGALVFVSGPSPPEMDLYEHVIQLAPQRLQSALG